MEQQLHQTSDQVASTSRRFTNLFIDTILYELGMFLLINPLIRLVLGDFLYANPWSSYLVAFIALFAYYFAFETVLQKTPGKFVTGTRVAMQDGSKPDIATIAKRTLIRFVPFDAVSMYTGRAPDSKGTWWHDRWTGTRVVRKASAIEAQMIANPQPAVPSPEPAVSNYGLRLLIMVGVVILGCVTATSGGTLMMAVIGSIFIGTRWTGNFWEDIFPFILMIAITGIGLFGFVKLIQVLQKKA